MEIVNLMDVRRAIEGAQEAALQAQDESERKEAVALLLLGVSCTMLASWRIVQAMWFPHIRSSVR